MSKQFIKKNLKAIFNIALAIAPVLVIGTASAFLWGETEVPESLK